MEKVITASEELYLRYYVVGDEEVLFEYTSDIESSKYLARERHKSVSQTRNMLLRLANSISLNSNDICVWIIADVSTKKPLGYLTLIKKACTIELHFGLLKKHRSKGYAKTAVKLAAEYLLSQLDYSEIISFTDTKNLAAKSVLEKAGFNVVSIKKEFYSAPLLPSTKRDVHWLRYGA